MDMCLNAETRQTLLTSRDFMLGRLVPDLSPEEVERYFPLAEDDTGYHYRVSAHNIALAKAYFLMFSQPEPKISHWLDQFADHTLPNTGVYIDSIQHERTHAQRCCREHGTHSMPHKGCILR